LLLSFNALAVTLLAIDQCMTNGDPAAYQMSEQAGMQMNIDCADTEQSWLSSTAQLLCDHGGNCQMGGVVVSSAAILPSVLPNHALPAFVRLGFNPAYPIAFWRPPRH
tara:strand:+ start:1130 stop:1453 length:324 start_codon:yes stop_codon:yes gene_type:complete